MNIKFLSLPLVLFSSSFFFAMDKDKQKPFAKMSATLTPDQMETASDFELSEHLVDQFISKKEFLSTSHTAHVCIKTSLKYLQLNAEAKQQKNNCALLSHIIKDDTVEAPVQIQQELLVRPDSLAAHISGYIAGKSNFSLWDDTEVKNVSSTSSVNLFTYCIKKEAAVIEAYRSFANKRGQGNNSAEHFFSLFNQQFSERFLTEKLKVGAPSLVRCNIFVSDKFLEAHENNSWVHDPKNYPEIKQLAVASFLIGMHMGTFEMDPNNTEIILKKRTEILKDKIARLKTEPPSQPLH